MQDCPFAVSFFSGAGLGGGVKYTDALVPDGTAVALSVAGDSCVAWGTFLGSATRGFVSFGWAP